jgi:hypothetical protein
VERADGPAPHILPPLAPVTLLYVRPAEHRLSALDAGLHLIVQRYSPAVELRVIAPASLPERFAQFRQRTPAVLVLRDGRLVAEATGAALPVRELDRVVHCAVEWARG